jgi:hypothetical protein
MIYCDRSWIIEDGASGAWIEQLLIEHIAFFFLVLDLRFRVQFCMSCSFIG